LPGRCIEPECPGTTVARGRCRRHWRLLRIAEGYTEPPRRNRILSGVCGDCGAAYSVTLATADQDRPDNICPGCLRTAINRRLARAQAAAAAAVRPAAPARPCCCECGGPVPVGRRRYCSAVCGESAARAVLLGRLADEFTRPCLGCGDQVRGVNRCEPCRLEWRRVQRKADKRKARIAGTLPSGNHRGRARHYGVAYVPGITRRAVCERDGWVCGICGGPVDPDLKFPDVMSASLDHVIPMARGGGHVWGNVQCAHFLCNSIKSDRPEGVARGHLENH
jgi:5-methylcytosine-specific restriction endonuclease McrA